MKDEIKERLKNSLEYEFELSFNDRKQLLDYITNLQEENENLKDYLKIMEKGKDNNLNRFLDYKSRCEKALDKLYCYGEVFDSKILQRFQKEMENILKGGDKDE